MRLRVDWEEKRIPMVALPEVARSLQGMRAGGAGLWARAEAEESMAVRLL